MTVSRNILEKFFNSLAFKIGIIIVIVEVLIFLAIGIYYTKHFSSQLEGAVEQQIKTPGILINQGVLKYDAIEDKEILANLIEAKILDGMVLGLNSRIFYSINTDYSGNSIAELESVNFPEGFVDFSINKPKLEYEPTPQGTYLHCLSPLFTLDGKTPRFFVYLKLDTSWIDEEKDKLALSFTISSFISVLLTSVLIFVFFDYFIFSKLISLTTSFRDIVVDLYATTIDEKIVQSKDEIGDLAKSFKSMAEKLKRTTTSIDNLNDEILIRKETEERLIIAEENYRKQFEGALDAIFVIDEHSNIIIECNPAASSLLQRSKEEIINQPQHIIYPPSEEVEIGLNDPAMNHMQESVGKNIELKVITKSGEIKEVGVRGSIFEVNNQKVVQGIFRDITEMKRALHEKEKLTEELNQAQKLKSIGTLAAGIAHEINTPVQFVGDNINFVQEEVGNLFKVVKDYKNLLEKCVSEGFDPAKAVEKLRNIEEEVDFSFIEEEFPGTFRQTADGIERIAKIVMAMKNFSHMGRDEKDTANMNEAVESTIIVTRNEWKLVAEIETNFARDLPLVNCFIADINQVMMNLIVNASHAIADKVKETNEKGLISITTRKKEEEVEMVVRDNGCGIPLDVREKVFDPFFTTKEVGKGTGQGLAIAYQVITEKHGGSISFMSEVGEGTTFIISIPIE